MMPLKDRDIVFGTLKNGDVSKFIFLQIDLTQFSLQD
jgi:hypothetical protein